MHRCVTSMESRGHLCINTHTYIHTGGMDVCMYAYKHIETRTHTHIDTRTERGRHKDICRRVSVNTRESNNIIISDKLNL